MQLESFTVLLSVPAGTTWGKFFGSLLPLVPTSGSLTAWPVHPVGEEIDQHDYHAVATFVAGRVVDLWSNSVEAQAGDDSGLEPDWEVGAPQVRVTYHLP